MKNYLIFVIAILAISSMAFAHKTRITYDVNSSTENPIIVGDPELSQAFYGQLRGSPDYYILNSSLQFKFYAQILVPDQLGAKTDYVAEIYKNGELFAILNGTNQLWGNFYEEFANDNYLTGPEFNQASEQGTYLIKVWDENNTGKYVLAIGETESFPIQETFGLMVDLFRLKSEFFGKSPFDAFSGKIGIFLIAFIAIIIVVLAILMFLIRFLLKRFGYLK